MKNILVYILLISCSNVFGQSYKVKQANFDHYYFKDAIFYQDEIGFAYYNLDKLRAGIRIITTEDKLVRDIIIGESFDYEKMYLCIAKRKNEKYYFTSLGLRNDSTFIVSSEMDIFEKQTNLREEFLGSSYLSNSITRQKKGDGYIYVMISSGRSGLIEQYCWMKLHEDNSISFNRIRRDEIQSPSLVFDCSLIGDIEFIDSTRFIAKSNYLPPIILFDDNYKVLDHASYIGSNFYYGGKIQSVNNNYINTTISGDNLRQDRTLLSFQVISDSLIFSDPYYFENIEKDKYSDPQSCSIDDIIFTGYEKNQPVGNLSRKSKFTISKFKSGQLLWTKDFGGDYNFSITKLICIRDQVYVIGRIFDFYKNGYTQGFYMKIDFDGNIVSSTESILILPDIQLHPNPTQNQIQLNSEYKKQVDFQLYNSMGQKVLSKPTILNNSKINLSHLPSATYFYQIMNHENQILKSGQIVKE